MCTKLKEIFLQHFYKYTLPCFIALFISILLYAQLASKALASPDSTIATATAKILKLSTNLDGGDNYYEVPENYYGSSFKNSENSSEWQILYQIYSEPNSFLNVTYADKLMFPRSEGDYLFLDLKNSGGSTIEARIKVDKNLIFFDNIGKGNIKLNPEIILKNKNQDNGIYRSSYYVVISY